MSEREGGREDGWTCSKPSRGKRPWEKALGGCGTMLCTRAAGSETGLVTKQWMQPRD